MAHADEEHDTLSPEARVFVRSFEKQTSQGADVEDLMEKALALQNRAIEKGEEERANALGEAINFIEKAYNLDSIAIAGNLAEAAVSDVDGGKIFHQQNNQATIKRDAYRKAKLKRESDEVPRVRAIIDKVAGLYGLTPDDLIGVNVPAINREARDLAIYIASETTTLTFAELGRLFRGISYDTNTDAAATIGRRNAIKKHMDEPGIKEKVESVMSELGLEVKERRPRMGFACI